MNLTLTIEGHKNSYKIGKCVTQFKEIFEFAVRIDRSLLKNNFKMYYQDDENDLVIVDNQEEFDSAINYAKIEGITDINFIINNVIESIVEEPDIENLADLKSRNDILEMSSDKIEFLEKRKYNDTATNNLSSDLSDILTMHRSSTNPNLSHNIMELNMNKKVMDQVESGVFPCYKCDQFWSTIKSMKNMDDCDACKNKKTQTLNIENIVLTKWFNYKIGLLKQNIENSKNRDCQNGAREYQNKSGFLGSKFGGKFSNNDHMNASEYQSSLNSSLCIQDSTQPKKSSYKAVDNSSPFKREICGCCGMNPIIGTKYQCLDCEDLFFCHDCYEGPSRDNPFIPKHEQDHKVVCVSRKLRMFSCNTNPQHMTMKKHLNTFSSNISYNAEFKCETMEVVVNYNEYASVKILVRNSGKVTFPKNTVLKSIKPKKYLEDISMDRLEPYKEQHLNFEFLFSRETPKVIFRFFSNQSGFFGKELHLLTKIIACPPKDLQYIFEVNITSKQPKKKNVTV